MNMNAISSLSNVEVKHLIHLQNKGFRYQQKQFVAEGFRTCATLIEAGIHPMRLYVTPAAYEAYNIEQLSHRFISITNEVAKHVSTTSTPSGIIGIFPFDILPLEVKAPGLVLAQVQDPGNLGTLLRTACAFNIKNVYCIETADPYHPKVVQATAGTIGQLNIYQTSWEELYALKKPEHTLAALVGQGGQNPNVLQADKNALLVVGNEAHGLPLEWVDSCKIRVTIPMPGGAESLNAAIAGSIGMYFMVQEKNK